MVRLFIGFSIALPIIIAVGVDGVVVPAAAQPYQPTYTYEPYVRSSRAEERREHYRAEERRDRIRDEERAALRSECKRSDERVAVTGGARPFEGWATRQADAMWSRSVRAKYGEDWSDIAIAGEHMVLCHPAFLPALTRCDVTAIPCKGRGRFVPPSHL
jgi:hypothetical protein